DKYNVIGRLKSQRSERVVPLPPKLVAVLREWKLQCPKGELGLCFPNGAGNIENLPNILVRGFHPAQQAAGVVAKGGAPKYTGRHALRHFFASGSINGNQDGGLELPLKLVQERLGHSSVVLTADRYSHLFPRSDDGSELASAEVALLG